MLNTRTLGTSLDRMLTLNRALDQAFNGVGSSRVWVPALDVAERGDAYVIHAELPGVSPGPGGRQLRAERPDHPRHQAGQLRRRQPKARCACSPRSACTAASSARCASPSSSTRIGSTPSFTNGLLTVTVPKAQAAQPRKITIRGRAEQDEQQQIAG